MTAAEVQSYLDQLPDERRKAILAVREVILKNLPEGLEEVFDFGMLTYVVPFSIQPKTYNGKPLMHCALANQKNHMSLYLMGIYGSEPLKARFESQYKATGKRYDVGASCVRFRKLDDLPLDVVAQAIRAVSMPDLIEMHQGAASLRKAKRSK